MFVLNFIIGFFSNLIIWPNKIASSFADSFKDTPLLLDTSLLVKSMGKAPIFFYANIKVCLLILACFPHIRWTS